MINSYNKPISEIPAIDGQALGYTPEWAIVKGREDLRMIIEEPCLAACLTLYDKNIQTVNSSANERNRGGKAYIGINYDSLEENNKQILKRLVEEGIVEPLNLSDNKGQRGGREVSIKVPVFEDDTVGKVSDRFLQIVSAFHQQDVLYGRITREGLIEEIKGFVGQEVEPDEKFIEEFATSIREYVYDEELDIFWKTQDLYNKHKKYQEQQKVKESKNQGDISK